MGIRVRCLCLADIVVVTVVPCSLGRSAAPSLWWGLSGIALTGGSCWQCLATCYEVGDSQRLCWRRGRREVEEMAFEGVLVVKIVSGVIAEKSS